MSSYIPQPDAAPPKDLCTVYLLRHGEVANAHRVCLNGHFDVELSETGRRQARQLADAFSRLPVSAVYCSDLQRTIEGARLLAEPHRLTPSACPELRELSFGRWEGLSVKELAEQHPGVLEQRFLHPETFRADGGESFQELHDRVVPKFRDIVEQHLGGLIVILAHGGVNRAILGHLLGFPLSNLFRISQDYAAVNRIQYRPGLPVVDFINGTHSLVA